MHVTMTPDELDDAVAAVLETIPGDADQYRAGYFDGVVALARQIHDQD